MDRFEYGYEFFSKMNPTGYILGLIIGTVLFLVLYELLGVRRYGKLLTRIAYSLIAIMIVSVFSMLFFGVEGIPGKIIVISLFLIILFSVFRNKYRDKRSFLSIKRILKKRKNQL